MAAELAARVNALRALPEPLDGAFIVLGPWPADPSPAYIESEMVPLTDGLSISYTSTMSVTVFYDD